MPIIMISRCFFQAKYMAKMRTMNESCVHHVKFTKCTSAFHDRCGASVKNAVPLQRQTKGEAIQALHRQKKIKFIKTTQSGFFPKT